MKRGKEREWKGVRGGGKGQYEQKMGDWMMLTVLCNLRGFVAFTLTQTHTHIITVIHIKASDIIQSTCCSEMNQKCVFVCVSAILS